MNTMYLEHVILRATDFVLSQNVKMITSRILCINLNLREKCEGLALQVIEICNLYKY